jgi:hypothetical protein
MTGRHVKFDGKLATSITPKMAPDANPLFLALS